jgi:hypothetical protein
MLSYTFLRLIPERSKLICMESITTQQEVLLIIGTHFTSNQYFERESTDSSRNLSPSEKLQEACWNGFVQDNLPEVFFPGRNPSKLYLWQLREANNFLSLEMGEYPKDIDSYHSIDPYLFLLHAADN